MAMNWEGDPRAALNIVDNCLESFDDMPLELAADIRRLMLDGEQLVAHWRNEGAPDLLAGAVVMHYVADHIVNCPVFRSYYPEMDGDLAMMVTSLVLRPIPDRVEL